MIDFITLRNFTRQESVGIKKDGRNFVLDSIDWDAPSVETNVYRVPYQIGSMLSNVIVGTRKITIIGYIIANTMDINTRGLTWEEYFQKQKEEIETNKEFLNDMISIYEEILIIVDGYYLKGYPTQPVKYSDTEEENNEVLCKFSIEIECFDPTFYKDSTVVHLAYVSPMFHFPLILTENKSDEYVVFGEVHKRQSALIENKGSIDVGCKIIIKAVGGSVINPKVYNVNTGEYVEFTGITLSDGETLTITTETGNENAIRHSLTRDTNESVIGFMKPGSDFFKVLRGSYYYAYSANEASMNNIDVTIEFTERFFNIRGM